MLKVLELFGGIGACSKALERLRIDYEIVDYVEIDKYAVKSFNAIHNTNFEPQDICTWDKDIKVDLIMHGSPCQDFSLAGKQAGGDKDSGTRSSLMYETIRIVEKLKPKYVIWENVKNLLSKKHIHNFNAYLETMEQLGYKNYYQVLNAKDYGIPQNRERVFTISILGNEKYEFPNDGNEGNLQDFLEQDVNVKTKPMCEKAFNKEYEQIITSDKDIYQCNVFSGYQDCKVGIKISPTIRVNNNCTHILQRFEFPLKQELKLKLKDMLEDEVDGDYFLTDKQIKRIEKTTYNVGKTRIQKKDWCDCLCARDFKDPKCVEVDKKYYLSDKMKAYISKTGTANYKNNDCKINLEIARPLTTDPNKRAGTTNYISADLPEEFNIADMDLKEYRIRKITPKECWRLMGFDDEDFEKASKVNSNTQLYKQAGNSIVVNVLEAILKELLK